MAPVEERPPITEFLNVDLDIYASYDLQPLVDALGKTVFALYVGRERRGYAGERGGGGPGWEHVSH